MILAELELLEHVKLTHTFGELDTLTVSVDLVRDLDKFYEIT